MSLYFFRGWPVTFPHLESFVTSERFIFLSNLLKLWLLLPQETHSWPYRSSNGTSSSRLSSPPPPLTSVRNHFPSSHPSLYSPYRPLPPLHKCSASDSTFTNPKNMYKHIFYFIYEAAATQDGWGKKRKQGRNGCLSQSVKYVCVLGSMKL